MIFHITKSVWYEEHFLIGSSLLLFFCNRESFRIAETHQRVKYVSFLCILDLEDDVWRKIRDSSDGPVLHLHGGHLQRVLQQRPHYLQLSVARPAHVWKKHMEVRTVPAVMIETTTRSVSYISLVCWSSSVLIGSPFLIMDPNVTGVFTSPYPFGIDPVRLSHSSFSTN